MNKLDNKLATDEIKQTGNKKSKRELIPFRDSAIEKISKTNINFELKRFKEFKFDVSKGSSLKGLLLRFSRNTERKYFTMGIWIHGKKQHYTIGQFPQIRCKEVERICLDLAETHQDERGLWLKNPNQTKADEKRLVEKPDTTITAGKSINEVIEDYCKGGFEKDTKFGKRTSKSCKIWFRYMAGYNKRKTLIDFEDDDSGSGVVKFVPNKRLRIIAPRDWQDLFRKFPPGKGIKKDREYYNKFN